MLIIKSVFDFIYKSCLKYFSFEEENERDVITDVHRSPYKEPVMLDRFLIQLQFSRQMFEKSSNIKFHENPPSENRAVPYGRRGG
jgi:hypothetical protein